LGKIALDLATFLNYLLSFKVFSYNANGDTIILKGTKSLNQETIIPFSGNIAVADVKNFEALTNDKS